MVLSLPCIIMYKVIKFFTDLHDNDYPYNVGDTFPRSGVSVSEGRFAELAGINNKQNQPLIQLVNETPKKTTTRKTTKEAAEK